MGSVSHELCLDLSRNAAAGFAPPVDSYGCLPRPPRQRRCGRQPCCRRRGPHRRQPGATSGRSRASGTETLYMVQALASHGAWQRADRPSRAGCAAAPAAACLAGGAGAGKQRSWQASCVTHCQSRSPAPKCAMQRGRWYDAALCLGRADAPSARDAGPRLPLCRGQRTGCGDRAAGPGHGAAGPGVHVIRGTA